VLLREWNPQKFAHGCVVGIFETALPRKRLIQMAIKAYRRADTMIDVRDLQ
jgi:hypothetical protein